jgi:hypothetical protein
MSSEAKDALMETLEFCAKRRGQIQADVESDARVTRARVAELDSLLVTLRVTKEIIHSAVEG